jgi:two-component system response regulator GlrR
VEGSDQEDGHCTNGDADDSATPPRVSTVNATFHFASLSARSPAMQATLATLSRLAPTELTITLIGETGTGKDVLTHAIHQNSRRSEAPFVIFDCGAVALHLAESELFGHERGAFTGAVAAHPGAFERANGGTLFLDEVGELPLELQPRLLRALENRGVRRVGGTQYRPVDCRVVAATNRDLKAQVAAGRFRGDLYFRLAAAVVAVPPLRDRPQDLELLVPKILEDLGRPGLEVPPETYEQLRSHRWPGNVRELKNVLSSSLAFLEGSKLLPEHLRLLAVNSSVALETLALGGQNLASLELAAIEQALALSDGNKIKAARSLGISPSTLYEKLRRHGR